MRILIPEPLIIVREAHQWKDNLKKNNIKSWLQLTVHITFGDTAQWQKEESRRKYQDSETSKQKIKISDIVPKEFQNHKDALILAKLVCAVSKQHPGYTLLTMRLKWNISSVIVSNSWVQQKYVCSFAKPRGNQHKH